MFNRSYRSTALHLSLGLFCAVSALTSASAGCLSSGAPAQNVIDGFKADPASALKGNTADVVRNVRAVVASDARVAGSVVKDMLPKADPVTRNALATGLGQAASICAAKEPTAATEIQRAVLATGDADFISAFRVASGDSRTTSVGAGGAGAGAAGGSGGSLGGAGVLGGNGNGGRGAPGFGPVGGFSLSNAAGGAVFSGGSKSVTYIQRASSAVSGNR